jgi:phosphinothricin acetyltransferase
MPDDTGDTPVEIRLATEADLPAIDAIYNWYIPRSTCTYQEQEDSFDSRVQWFHSHGPAHPITVGLIAGQIVGWASLSPFKERSAYRHTVENSIYLHHDHHGQGLGSALLQDLIDRARAAAHHTIIAIIDAEQISSLALHKKFGFEQCALLKEAGRKFDRWRDVIYMQLTLVNP